MQGVVMLLDAIQERFELRVPPDLTRPAVDAASLVYRRPLDLGPQVIVPAVADVIFGQHTAPDCLAAGAGCEFRIDWESVFLPVVRKQVRNRMCNGIVQQMLLPHVGRNLAPYPRRGAVLDSISAKSAGSVVESSASNLSGLIPDGFTRPYLSLVAARPAKLSNAIEFM